MRILGIIIVVLSLGLCMQGCIVPGSQTGNVEQDARVLIYKMVFYCFFLIVGLILIVRGGKPRKYRRR